MELINISKKYYNKNNNVQALSKINLAFKNIGLIFIFGASGCGKTTLLNIISQKDCDYDGEIIYDGKVEMIEQEIMLFESMSVLDNLLLVCKSKDRIVKYLRTVGLTEIMNKKIINLSVGQRKRVQVIRSLLVDFDYLICDEPTASLDKNNAKIIIDLLKEISQKKCVIIVTHEKDVAYSCADRVISMREGTIDYDKAIVSTQNLLTQKNEDLNIPNQISMSFAIKNLKSKIPISIFKVTIIFLMSFLILVVISLLPSLNKELKIQKKWRDSDNLIVTQSKVDNQETGDLYDKASIQMIKDNIDGVIAYKYGWTASHLSSNIFTPEMNVDDIRNAIIQSDRLYMEKNIPLPTMYQKWKRELEKIEEYEQEDGHSFSKDIMICRNLSHYDCFSRNEDGSFRIPIFDPNVTQIGDYFQGITPYQLFDGTSIDLKTGNMLRHDNEVIINSNLANLLCKQYSLNSIEDLKDKEYSIHFLEAEEPFSVKITGITFEENDDEYRVFFKEGALDDYIERAYQLNTDYPIQYLFIDLLCDGNYDEKKIANQLNGLLNSQKSIFVPFRESVLTTGLNNHHDYTVYFYISLGVGIILIFTIYLFVLIYNRKKYKKEMKILRHFHYTQFEYIYFPIITSFLCVTIIQYTCLPMLSQYLNKIANLQGYPNLINDNMSSFLFSMSITYFIVLMIEGGFYVFKTGKH